MASSISCFPDRRHQRTRLRRPGGQVSLAGIGPWWRACLDTRKRRGDSSEPIGGPRPVPVGDSDLIVGARHENSTT